MVIKIKIKFNNKYYIINSYEFRCQEILHVRSIYSDDVFPVGWCNKNKYPLSVPKLPYTDCNDYDNCYYASDIDIEFNKSNENDLLMYSQYFKGEIPYHFSKKYNFLFIYIYLKYEY